MPPKMSPVLTSGEKRIMDILWRRGHGSVREIHDELQTNVDIAYNTVLSTLRTMTDKGYVRYHKDGRAFVYSPAITESAARDKAIKTLLSRFFDDSPRAFAQHLVQDGDDDDALAALMAEIQAAEKANGNE